MFPPGEHRVSVLGEFGGLGLPVEGHTWLDKDNWGYRTYETIEALNDAYEELLVRMPLLIGKGLGAAVYTQTTDVEVEVNGMLTYDREILKFDVDRVNRLHARLYEPPPKVSVVLPTSEEQPQAWRYTTTAPADHWMQPAFDASAWQTGPGGLGTRGTPGTVVRSVWDTPEVWLRRDFTLPRKLTGQLGLRIHHDEDAVVYLNGKRIGSMQGYTTNYVDIPLPPSARDALVEGRNVLAVQCKQTGGGQYIDVGLVELTAPE
jgi:hypothetical protein